MDFIDSTLSIHRPALSLPTQNQQKTSPPFSSRLWVCPSVHSHQAAVIVWSKRVISHSAVEYSRGVLISVHPSIPWSLLKNFRNSPAVEEFDLLWIYLVHSLVLTTAVSSTTSDASYCPQVRPINHLLIWESGESSVRLLLSLVLSFFCRTIDRFFQPTIHHCPLLRRAHGY